MSEKIRVGLTGGIGAGKSTVASALQRLGAEIIDADAIYAELVRPGGSGIAALAAEFGDEVVAEDGGLNRAALGAIVFGNEAALERLNQITHPMIREKAGRRVAASGAEVIVEDIPLLTETGQHDRFDLILVVEADEEVKINRLRQNRGLSEEEALARMRNQATDEQRRAIADVVLHNHGDVDELLVQVDHFWSTHITPMLNSSV